MASQNQAQLQSSIKAVLPYVNSSIDGTDVPKAAAATAALAALHRAGKPELVLESLGRALREPAQPRDLATPYQHPYLAYGAGERSEPVKGYMMGSHPELFAYPQRAPGELHLACPPPSKAGLKPARP